MRRATHLALQRLASMRKLAHGVVHSGFFVPRGDEQSNAADHIGQMACRPNAAGIVQLIQPFRVALNNLGFTTVCHSLADSGAEVIKPDMHAARALIYFAEVNGGQG